MEKQASLAFKHYWLVFWVVVFAAQQSFAGVSDSVSAPVDSIHWKRVGVVGGMTTVAFAASWGLVLKNAWWDSSGTDFHFKNDFEYAKNLDKAGHFFAGVLLGETFYEGFRWSGLSEFQSYLWAGSMAGLTHVAIDIKDGYSSWGYSVWDVAAGTAGGFWPMAQRYVPGFKYLDYKFGYWVHSRAYWDQPGEHASVFTDDYCNQTHWLSLLVNDLLPRKIEPYWPDWMAIAVGLSVEEGIFQGSEALQQAHRQVYIGLDWNLEGFKPKAPWAKKALHFLNYVRWPSPAVRVYPDWEVQWLLPIEF